MRSLLLVGFMLYGFVSPALAVALAPSVDVIKLDLSTFKIKPKHDVIIDGCFGYDETEDRIHFCTFGSATGRAKVPADGDYVITVRAACQAALNENAKFKLYVDDKEVGEETKLTSEEPDDYQFTVKLKAGEVKISVEFTNDVYKEGEYDRNFYLHGVKLEKK